MIEIRDLWRRYDETVAVRDFSVSIRRGEIVGLLGHNGAGKSTVMKVLTGSLEPSRGAITVDGHDVVTEREQVQRQIGYLPENAPLYPEMLVQEYLLLIAELRGIPEAERISAVARAVRLTDLQDHLVDPIDTLSKGYRQRVGLAQAIVHRPDVLVLDEPTNGLDPIQIQAIRDLIKRLGANSTVILSTHILQEVEAVCDRVLVMIDGALVEDAPLRDFLSSSEIRLCLSTDARDVEARLASVAGVECVRSLGSTGARDGYSWWRLDCAPGAAPVPDIIEMAAASSWKIDSVARRRRSLDSVFQQLQREHLAAGSHAEAREEAE